MHVAAIMSVRIVAQTAATIFKKLIIDYVLRWMGCDKLYYNMYNIIILYYIRCMI